MLSPRLTRVVMILLLTLSPAAVLASTPQTIVVDGTNDFLAENLLDPDGYDAEFPEIDLDSVFVTNDGNNVYIGIQYDQGGWPDCCIGVAIDLGDAFGGLTDPWGRQIDWSEAPYPPNFIPYVNVDNNWQELRSWTGTFWTVPCGGYGGCGYATATGFKEYALSLSTLGVSAGDTLYLESWTTQGSTKGALDLAASDSRQESTPEGTTWNPEVPTQPDQYLAYVVLAVADTAPPVLEEARHLVDEELRLTFSEAVDPATAEIASHYAVPGVGVDSARVDGSDPRYVDLYLDQDLSAGPDCISVTVTGVEDLAGNPIVEDGVDNVAHFFIKGVLFRGHMEYYLRGWVPGSSVSFSVEGAPDPLTWTLCDNLAGDADADSVFAAYAEFSLVCEGAGGPTVEETAYFKFVHNCIRYESLPQNRSHALTSATGARDTLDLWWENLGPRDRGPYLSWQNEPASTMTVCWQTRERGTSRVDYGPDAGYGYAEGESVLVEWHTVELSGLDMGAAYHYRASSSSGFVSDDLEFETGGAAGGSFQYLVYGDSRSDSSAHQAVVDRMEMEGAMLVLHTGDLVADGRVLPQWNTFFDITKDLVSERAFMPALGNHEENAQLYFDFFALPNAAPPSNEQWYSFTVGGAHFVALSTETSYFVGSAQYNWLVNDLAQASTASDWIFVYFHRPPFSSGPHGSDLNVRNTLCPVFETYGASAVFSGHDHLYERSLYNGITYIVAAGGGAPLYNPNQNPNPYQIYAEGTYHFCRVTVGPVSCLIEAVKPDGSVFDSVVLQPTAVASDGSVAGSPPTRLVAVWPNPSAGGIDVRYSLAARLAVRLAVYDVRGREVNSLVDRVEPSGVRSVRWDRTDRHGKTVPPGVYWIRLSAEGVRDVRKLVLVE